MVLGRSMPGSIGTGLATEAIETTTSTKANRPPGARADVTRRNRFALPRSSRWWMASAETTRSNGPSGRRSSS